MKTSGGCSFSSLLRATSPRLSSHVSSPLCSPVHSILPLPEPKVIGCKRNFVHWPFKRLFASPAVSPWQTESPLLFTAGCYWFFSQLWWLGSSSWGLEPTLLRGKPLASEISLQYFSCCPASPLMPPPCSLPVLLQ